MYIRVVTFDALHNYLLLQLGIGRCQIPGTLMFNGCITIVTENENDVLDTF